MYTLRSPAWAILFPPYLLLLLTGLYFTLAPEQPFSRQLVCYLSPARCSYRPSYPVMSSTSNGPPGSTSSDEETESQSHPEVATRPENDDTSAMDPPASKRVKYASFNAATLPTASNENTLTAGATPQAATNKEEEKRQLDGALGSLQEELACQRAAAKLKPYLKPMVPGNLRHYAVAAYAVALDERKVGDRPQCWLHVESTRLLTDGADRPHRGRATPPRDLQGLRNRPEREAAALQSLPGQGYGVARRGRRGAVPDGHGVLRGGQQGESRRPTPLLLHIWGC